MEKVWGAGVDFHHCSSGSEANLAAGFTNKHDRLPDFFEEPCPPHNAVWDFTDEEIDSFWNF